MTKVSPNVIKQIKTLGMTKALASAKSNKNNAAYITGLKRMYGAKRVNDALGYKAGAGKSRPVGGVMGSSKYKNVMGGSSVKSSTKKTTAKKTTAKKVVSKSALLKEQLAARAPKSKMFSNLGAGVSVPRKK